MNDLYYSIRGATTVSENSKSQIIFSTKELIKKILDMNKVEIDDIICIVFTATSDLTKVYPAVAARELGILNSSLLCMQEMYVENSLPKCIRVMMLVKGDKPQSQAKHIYLNEAKILRPDL